MRLRVVRAHCTASSVQWAKASDTCKPAGQRVIRRPYVNTSANMCHFVEVFNVRWLIFLHLKLKHSTLITTFLQNVHTNSGFSNRFVFKLRARAEPTGRRTNRLNRRANEQDSWCGLWDSHIKNNLVWKIFSNLFLLFYLLPIKENDTVDMQHCDCTCIRLKNCVI